MIISIENVENKMATTADNLVKIHAIAKDILKNWKTTTRKDLYKLSRVEYYMTLAYVEQRYFELENKNVDLVGFKDFWQFVITKGPTFSSDGTRW